MINKYYDVISYLFFGVLTTVVNFLIYFPLYNWFHFSGVLSNMIAWAVAVLFAFLTNKPFVFKSYDWSRKVVVPELAKFVSCRIGSGVMETMMIWMFVDLISFNGNLVKIIVSFLVVILNYISSKWIVFSGKDKK